MALVRDVLYIAPTTHRLPQGCVVALYQREDTDPEWSFTAKELAAPFGCVMGATLTDQQVTDLITRTHRLDTTQITDPHTYTIVLLES